MTRARFLRLLRYTGYLGAAAFVAAAALVGWLTTTGAGFRYLLGLGAHIPGVVITASGVTGTPAGGFTVANLVIEHERVRIEIHDLRARINPVFLAGGMLNVSQLDARAVRVHVKPIAHPPDHTPPQFMPAYLRVTVDAATIGRLTVDDDASPLYDAHSVSAGASVSRTRIRIAHLSGDAGAYRIAGDAELTAADPLGVVAAATIAVPIRNGVLVAHARATGNLDVLHVGAQLEHPSAVGYDGEVSLAGPVRLDGTLTLAISDLAPLAIGAPLGKVSARLAVSGGFAGLAIDGPVTLDAAPLGPIGLSVRARYQHDVLVLEQANATTANGGPAVAAHGTVQFAPRIQADLDLGWRALRWPLAGRATVESDAGSGHIGGAGPYEWRLAGDVRAPGVPAAAVSADGALHTDRVDVPHLLVRALGGTVRGSASAAWRGPREWSLTLAGTGLDPGLLRPPLTGRIDFAASASGRGYDPYGDWDGRVTRLAGQVRGKAVAGGGSARMHAGELVVQHGHVQLASLTAAVDGTLALARGQIRPSRLTVDAELGNIGDFIADGSGQVRLHGVYGQTRVAQQLSGTLEARHVRAADTALESLSAHASLDSEAHDASSLSIAARGLRSATTTVEAVDLTVDGLAADHALRISAQSGARQARLEGRGRYVAADRTEHLQLQTLTIDAPKLAHYELVGPAPLEIGPMHGSLAHTCVGNGDSTLCLGGDWQSAGPWSAAAEVTNLPVGLLPLPLLDGSRWTGALSAHAQVHGLPGAPALGEVAAQLDGVEFHYRAASGRDASVRIGSGTITAYAQPASYAITANVRTTAESFLAIDAKAAREAGHGIGESALDGHVRMRTRELDLLPLLVRDIDRVSGLLEADVKLTGTVARPELGGTLAYTDGAADVYLSNLRLRQIAANVGLHGRTLDLDARAHAGDGQLAATGSLSWDAGVPTGTLNFTGDNLLVANLPEARVVASPDVRLAIKGDHVDVRGDIRIPNAHIAPKDISTAVRVSGDEVVVSARGAPDEPPVTVDAQVKVTLGDDVRVAAYGLKGLIAGSILVTAKTDELVTGSGDLEIRDGHYLAYARELDIERGRLLFRGGPVDNAGLDIRASRKLPGYTAGVNVRGTLQAPSLSFFSDPSLPQSQIASLLIVGQTTDVSNGGSLLAAQGSALLVADYTHYLGVDQMTIESDSNNGTALVLGKFLSPRLYVSYGISLAQSINTLKLRYTIGDNWVINTESGVNHSADIQYSFKR